MSTWLDLAALKPHAGPSQAELEAFARLTSHLEGLGVGLPRWVLWDLWTVGRHRPTKPGAGFKKDRGGLAWEQWLTADWRPILSRRSIDGLGATALLQLAAVTNSWQQGSRGAAGPGAWAWHGGERLLKAALDREEPTRLLGWTVLQEVLGETERPDPFLRAIGSAARDRSERIRLIGSFTKSRSDDVEDGPTGEFDKRFPGPLPEDVGRIDPFELVLAREAPSYFLQRVAENQVGQRFFKVSRPASTVPRVLFRIELQDTVASHRFPEQGLPSASRERVFVPALVESVARRAHPDPARTGPDMELHLAVHTHAPLPGFPSAAVTVGPEILKDWSSRGREPILRWLSEQLPLLGSTTPSALSLVPARSPANEVADRRTGWDRRVKVTVGGAAGVLSIRPPDEGWDLELQVAAEEGTTWRLEQAFLGTFRRAMSESDILAEIADQAFESRRIGVRPAKETPSPIIEL